MSKEFLWTDELVKEFLKFREEPRNKCYNWFTQIKFFTDSKQPKEPEREPVFGIKLTVDDFTKLKRFLDTLPNGRGDEYIFRYTEKDLEDAFSAGRTFSSDRYSNFQEYKKSINK